ncbi:MAG: hypothetical protein H7A24_01490 [Leptospiraceae bacterium]|nr:hypothetical protein [Leptospiraceae bacterium]MCP5510527.1 hypothetical protein [Leptospiraceae bacterium]
MDSSPIKSFVNRVRKSAETIDELLQSVSEDLESKRKSRESWFEWHNLWKKAWIDDKIDPPLPREDRDKLKEETTVTKRYNALDL